MAKSQIYVLATVDDDFVDPFYPERGIRSRGFCRVKSACGGDLQGVAVIWMNDGESKRYAHRYQWEGKCEKHTREWCKREKKLFPGVDEIERRRVTMAAALDVARYLQSLPDQVGWYDASPKSSVAMARLNRQGYEDACMIFGTEHYDDSSCVIRQKRFKAEIFETASPEEITRELLAYVRGLAINCWELPMLSRSKKYLCDEDPDIVGLELDYIEMLNRTTGIVLNPYEWSGSMIDIETHSLRVVSNAENIEFLETEKLVNLEGQRQIYYDKQKALRDEINELTNRLHAINRNLAEIDKEANVERARQLKTNMGFRPGCFVVDERGDRYRIDGLTWPLRGVQVDEEGKEGHSSYPVQLGTTLGLLAMDENGKLVAA